MATGLTQYDALPESAKPVAKALARLGFTEGRWTFVENSPIISNPEFKNIQVRENGPGGTTALSKTDVSNYADSMRMQRYNRTEFPPAVQSRDGYLIDGAHRTAAAAKAGWRFFPTFILDLPYENAPTALANEYAVLGAALNLSHGRGLSKNEKLAMIRRVSLPDDSPRDITARLGGGLTESFVSQAMNADKARDRAAQLGVSVEGLSASHLTTLGSKSQKFNDEPWRKLVEVTVDAKISTVDLAPLAKRLETMPTDQGKIDALNQELSSRTIVKRGNSAGSRATTSNQVRRSAGLILKYKDDPTALVETSSEHADEYEQVLRTTIDVLEAALKAQVGLSHDRYI